MRVTKLIKEYIEKAVAEKIPDKAIPEFSEGIALYDKAEQKYYKLMKEHARETAKIVNREYNIPKDFQLRLREDPYGSLEPRPWWNSPTHVKNNTHLQDILRKRRNIVTDILLTLELGGNKETLEAMLAAIESE